MQSFNHQNQTMSNAYQHQEIEAKWEKFREEHKCFAATMDPNKPNYSIVIPPPNVTGVLHMGHVLNNSIQDVLIRRKRMSGFNTLRMPGTDHAGIATQNKVERKLADEGKTKEDIGREEFIKQTRERKEKHGGLITTQLRKLWASLDRDRERFTMDEGLSDAVKEMFIKLYNDNLIYQGEYMVNRCPRCGTALADDEVEHEDEEGFFRELKYPIIGTNDFIILATTRPETMLGDTGIAVNPRDPRYKDLVGKKVLLPLMEREIPVVADEYVDMEFWTGAVKMTPAHDPNDYEVGKRTGLEILNIFTPDGKINENGGKYEGMERFEARKVIVEDLKKGGFLGTIKKHTHAVGHCYRCATIVEPRISRQRFVKMVPLAKPALDVVKNGEITIQPKRREKVYYHWLENIRDRCISRQIRRGHRIPARYGPDNTVFVARDDAEAQAQAEKHYGKAVQLIQEQDVLDTRFSSALRPFSTMGRPEKSKELEMFYPTNVLVTAADIIFFRVARMIMAGMYEMKEIPFHDVFLHGIVRDEQGRKMSKSLGNSPDPLDLIKEYGADAIRFTMIYNTSQGQDVHFSIKLLEMGRNFANKVWNASNFVLMNLEGFDHTTVNTSELKLELVDNRIYSRLHSTIKTVNEKLDKYILDEAAKSVFEFIKWDFCDRYVEMAKVRLYNNDDVVSKTTAQYVLRDVLEQSLRLLHPFMPFVTEECRQQLATGHKTIMLQDYPKLDEKHIVLATESAMEYIQEVTTSIRNIRAEAWISPAKNVTALIKSGDTKELEVIENNKNFIMKLAKLDTLEASKDTVKPDLAGFRVAGKSEIYIPLAGLLDVEAESKKINDQIEKLEVWLVSCKRKLADETFMSKAPAQVIEREKNNEADYLDKIEKLKKNLELLKK